DLIGQAVCVGGNRFSVIGVLESKGNSMGFGGDNQALIPLKNARLNFQNPASNYTISIQTMQATEMEAAKSAAIVPLRNICKDKPGEKSSFDITQSDNLANMIMSQLSLIVIIA